MFNNKLQQLDAELKDFPLLAAQMRQLKQSFTDDTFVPRYTGITGNTAAYGHYQRLGSIIFVHILFYTTTNITVAANATITLPFKPYQRNGQYVFSAHDFKLSQVGASGEQACWMDATNGLVKPTAAYGPVNYSLVLSGFYLAE